MWETFPGGRKEAEWERTWSGEGPFSVKFACPCEPCLHVRKSPTWSSPLLIGSSELTVYMDTKQIDLIMPCVNMNQTFNQNKSLSHVQICLKSYFACLLKNRLAGEKAETRCADGAHMRSGDHSRQDQNDVYSTWKPFGIMINQTPLRNISFWTYWIRSDQNIPIAKSQKKRNKNNTGGFF